MTIEELIAELESRTLDVYAAAVFLNTHPSYVRRLVSKGQLRSYRIVGRMLLDRDDLRKEHKLREERRAKDPTIPIHKPKGFAAWTVLELRRELRYRKLSTQGRKTDLVARLQESD